MNKEAIKAIKTNLSATGSRRTAITSIKYYSSTLTFL